MARYPPLDRGLPGQVHQVRGNGHHGQTTCSVDLLFSGKLVDTSIQLSYQRRWPASKILDVTRVTAAPTRIRGQVSPVLSGSNRAGYGERPPRSNHSSRGLVTFREAGGHVHPALLSTTLACFQNPRRDKRCRGTDEDPWTTGGSRFAWIGEGGHGERPPRSNHSRCRLVISRGPGRHVPPALSAISRP